MLRSFASSTLTLPNLIGVSIADAACVLSTEQFVQLGALLLQQRPQDAQAVCFLGGALSGLASGRRNAQNVVALAGDLGDDPFLVIAGQQAAVALLAAPHPDGFRVRLLCDPNLVDRAALVLAQFGDLSYSLDALCEPEAQRGFVAAVAAAVCADPSLRGASLSVLFGDERPWLDLARAIAGAPGPQLLGLPDVRRLLQSHGVACGVAGPLDADLHRLSVVTATEQAAPRALSELPAFVAGAARAQRTSSATPTDTAALGGELGAWAAGKAITAVPMLRDGRAWGLLLTASERPLAVAARAALNGLATLLIGAIGSAPAPTANARELLPAPAPAPASRPVPSAMLGLAARLSGGVRPAPPMPTAPSGPAPSTPNGNGRPLLAPLTEVNAAPALRAQVPSLAQRTMALGRGESATTNVGDLLEHLSDGIVLADSQGRLVGFTRTAMQMLGLQPESRGKSLVASGAWALASLFAEALTGELDGPREVELPDGRSVSVDVISMDGGNWAFVMRSDATQPALPESAAVARLPTVAEGERSESFLANFSNIIRVPLRELRELITKVPAMGNLNEQQSRLIGQVVRLNSEMTMLVNDLLALGQIRLETSENRAPLRIDLLVEAAVGTQYAEFGRRGQHVITEIQPGLPRVRGSEEGLARAVSTLIDNAIKYSPAGAQIKVAVSREGSAVSVAVQDNGPGLEAEELAQVFDLFFRAPSTEPLGVSGRGLGLTIAKAVIEQHGGRIWATGALGQGCAFAFTIPCE